MRQPANVGEYGRQWGQKDPLRTPSRPAGPATPTVDEQPVMAVAGLGPVAKLARSHSCFQLEPGRCLGRQTFRWIFLLANRCLICENHFGPGLRTRRFSWHQTQGQSSQLQANKGEQSSPEHWISLKICNAPPYSSCVHTLESVINSGAIIVFVIVVVIIDKQPDAVSH